MLEKISLIRIVYEFYPLKGGSITHICELSEKINPYLEKQVVLAPFFNENVLDNFPFSVIRIRSNKIKNILNFNPLKIMLYSINVTKEISKLSKLDCFDVIHAHGVLLGSFTRLFMILFRVKIPLITMIHGWYSRRARSFGVTYFFEKKLLCLFPPSYVILLDDGTEIKEIEQVLQKNNTPYKIVYHGIDTNFYGPSNFLKGNDIFYILFPHRPISVKRPDLAIEIFNKFFENLGQKDVKLIFLAAQGSYNLKKIVSDYSLENFVEFVEEQDKDGVKQYLDICDVVIGTSLESNTGRAIQEAMACGKSIIVFNNGGISNLIENGEDGILIEPGNLDEFARALLLLYQNPELRIKLGKKACNKISEKRTWDTRIKEELSIYNNLVNNI